MDPKQQAKLQAISVLEAALHNTQLVKDQLKSLDTSPNETPKLKKTMSLVQDASDSISRTLKQVRNG